MTDIKTLSNITESRLDKKDMITCVAITNQKFSTCSECYNACCSQCTECGGGQSISDQCQGDISSWSFNPCCQCIYRCHNMFNPISFSPNPPNKADTCPGGGGGGLPNWNSIIGCSNGLATGKITPTSSPTVSNLGNPTTDSSPFVNNPSSGSTSSSKPDSGTGSSVGTSIINNPIFITFLTVAGLIISGIGTYYTWKSYKKSKSRRGSRILNNEEEIELK